LLAGVPLRLVAALHDTSVMTIERVYARYIVSDASDKISRRALLDMAPSPGDVVVPIGGRK
jgi:hypothetical protein